MQQHHVPSPDGAPMPTSSNGPPLPVNMSYVLVGLLEQDTWKQRILFVDWEQHTIRFAKWNASRAKFSKYEIPVFELYQVVPGIDKEILIYTTSGSVFSLRASYEHEHAYLFKLLGDVAGIRNDMASGSFHWGAIQQRWLKMQKDSTANANQAGLVKRAHFRDKAQTKKAKRNVWVVVAGNRIFFYANKKSKQPNHVLTVDANFTISGSQEDSEIVVLHRPARERGGRHSERVSRRVSDLSRVLRLLSLHELDPGHHPGSQGGCQCSGAEPKAFCEREKIDAERPFHAKGKYEWILPSPR